MTAKVSIDRVNNFLNDTELLDQFTDKDALSAEAVVPPPSGEPEVIGIRGAAFTWSNENDGALTPGPNRRNFTLRIEDEVVFKRGKINLIVGPTGAGKTSLLMALLGELHYIPNGPDSWVSLPRAGGIAYAAQESWVQNETIRDNILFGAPYDEERYKKGTFIWYTRRCGWLTFVRVVINQCALKRDLTLFDAGDMTEVGEKGLTLSGGQKARITLARAVYSRADILLLDDVLAALDVHTSRWIVDKCFKGDLLKGRTIVLVVRLSLAYFSLRASIDVGTTDAQRRDGVPDRGLCCLARHGRPHRQSRLALQGPREGRQVVQGACRGAGGDGEGGARGRCGRTRR